MWLEVSRTVQPCGVTGPYLGMTLDWVLGERGYRETRRKTKATVYGI